MRITSIVSTDLFRGTAARPLQIVRVTLVNDGPGMLRDPSAVTAVGIYGAGIGTPEPARISGLVHGEERTAEVAVQIGAWHQPGRIRPVTAIARHRSGYSEAPGQITIAEPGWTMWMVSHFHYDPVWWNTQGGFAESWPLLPGQDGTLPDVRTVFELVRLHLEAARSDPDYKFVLAEIDYLKPYVDAHPQDRTDLRALIGQGRIEIVGGSYNEPNTNLTCAESTIRNAILGLAYQREVLGADPTTAWMLDAFGFDPGYPGLMAAAGLTESSWARGPFHQWGPGRSHGGNAQMQYPSEFEWLSPDGSGLLTSYMPNHYSAGWITQHAQDLEAAEQHAYEQFCQLAHVAATRNVLLPVGGDHVVPSRWASAIHRDWNARYLWPRFVTAVPSEFFAAVRAEAAASGAWFLPQTRDMNPVYPGKDVSYIDTKQAQRDAEIALLDGERLATLAWLAGARYPAASLDRAWRLLAFGAHHDAITGTESDQVYLDLLAGWREAFDRGDRARRDAMRHLASLADTSALVSMAAPHGAVARPVPASASVAVVAGAGAGPASVEPVAEPPLVSSAASSAHLAGPDGNAPYARAPAGTRPVLVFNTLSWPRSGMAAVPLEFAPADATGVLLRDESGTAVPFLATGVTRHPDGSLATVTLTFRAPMVPAVGYRAFAALPVPPGGAVGWDGEQPVPAGPHAGDLAASTWRDVDGLAIDNDVFTVTADYGRGGVLRSIVHRDSGAELLAGPGNELLLQEEYPAHPRWGEGPWLLCPTGEVRGSASVDAVVRAQRCPIGARLVADFTFNGLRVTQETVLWNGAELVEFRTHVDGSIGKNRLLRARFGADVPGGLPVYQTALSVIGRPAGPHDVDVAEHTYTLDNPAHEWFGIGSTARLALTGTGGERRLRAFGVAEVVAPAGPSSDPFAPRDPLAGTDGANRREAVRNLMLALARQGVTATCSVPEGPRYGSIELDSNLPDIRIALGGPAENAFTAQALAAAGPASSADLDAQLAASGTARVWIPATRGRMSAFDANADLRGLADLPVLVVAGDDLGAAVADLVADLADAEVEVTCPDGALVHEPGLADYSVALFNRGIPGSLVTPAGEACINLMRACSEWPSGVWIDGEKRVLPDGSSFALQHWSHTFEYALAAGPGDWRAAGFASAGQEYCHQLLACETSIHTGSAAASASLASVTPAGIDLMALKPHGNPLVPADEPDPRGGVTVRLRDLAGRADKDGGTGKATVRLFTGIAAAQMANLLEEPDGQAADCADSAATAVVPARGTATLVVHPQRPGTRAAISPGDMVPSDPGPADEVQPTFTRYWLHGAGPAPEGNLPVAVHLSPRSVTLQGVESATVALTVACGCEPAAGVIRLAVPDGVRVLSEGEQVSALRYDMDAEGWAAWNLAVQALPGTRPGRSYLTARIDGGPGNGLQDAVGIEVRDEAAPRGAKPASDIVEVALAAAEAEAAEVVLTSASVHLALAPGGRGEIQVRLSNNTGSVLRADAQLISPHGSWIAVPGFATGFSVPAGSEREISFPVTIPADARPGTGWWALVKVMYFGHLRYSKPVWIEVTG